MKRLGWSGEYPSSTWDGRQKRSGRAADKRAFERECDPGEFDGIEREIDADFAVAEEENRKP